MVVPSPELDTKTTASLQELLWLSLSSCDYAPKEHCYMTQSYFQHATFEPRSSEDQATRTLNIWGYSSVKLGYRLLDPFSIFYFSHFLGCDVIQEYWCIVYLSNFCTYQMLLKLGLEM